MISHANEDLLLLAACMLVPVETQLRSRWKGCWLSVVGLLGCTHATKHPLDCSRYLHSQGRPKFLKNMDWIPYELHKQGRLSRGSKLAKYWSFLSETVWDSELSTGGLFWEELYVIVSCIHVEYTIEDSGVLRNKLSPRNYMCCGLIDSSLLHVIGNCVFLIPQLICRINWVFNFSTLLDKIESMIYILVV